MNQSLTQIASAVNAGQPLIQIVSFEERRVESYLRKMTGMPLWTWDQHSGLGQGEQAVPGTADPVAALTRVIAEAGPGFFVFRDLSPLLPENPALVRKLRECYQALKGNKKTLFLLSPDAHIPDMLRKEIDIVTFELPDPEELEGLLRRFLDQLGRKGVALRLREEELSQFVIGLQGLTLDEATKVLMKTFLGQAAIGAELLPKVHAEKKQLILKEGVLEYVTSSLDLKDMGGLDKLKDWLAKRRKAFSKEARQFGIDRPRGVLTMGITGCGKSLASKVIASLWNLPLFRLDMNMVYSGIAGAPEDVFSRALKTMDSVAPAVLWIDEIESGISDKSSDSSSSRILGYFLTWMQEHTSEIFIAATANRIDLLPAELLRRGRFDQIFFLDLPSRKEREEIFRIHLTRRGNDPAAFNLPQLSQITKGWSGSEIEQAIISAMVEAFNADRPLNEDDLFVIFGSSVPMSTTMEEQIKKIRSWAHNRAVRASSEKEY